ncbi:TIGR03086 family metal-binding protein [Streptomyces yunnanensis]|uniref:TIGR03086 family protein n=1 Tax=Streptomyces yunnanensis TaxID=156453 RepID=A0A9X8N443_9ACTN|nr:TIGR03086 family metal-binding protein [Streptomyces yunnanensis]SHM90267.1 TIGR03086 family protein [Streptomyces yunnanensis]
MTEVIELLGKTLTHTTRLLKNVTPEQYGQPTPCAEFDVYALANHLVAGNLYYVRLAQGGAPDFSLFAQDQIGGRQPGDAYAQGAEDALDAWRTEGAVERQMPMPGGGQGPLVTDLHLLEATLHGWDVATATGQDRRGDPDAVQAVHQRWYGRFPDALRSQTRLFDPSRPVPEGAPALDEIAAYFGRTV